MANSYVLISATRTGDSVNIVATVNGVQVQACVQFNWWASFPSTAALQAALTPILLGQVPMAVSLPTSSWSL